MRAELPICGGSDAKSLGSLEGERCRTVVLLLQGTQLPMRELMILASDIPPSVTDHAVVVSTPLDAIVGLEKGRLVRMVVLAGTFARDEALASFISERYPSVYVECEC